MKLNIGVSSKISSLLAYFSIGRAALFLLISQFILALAYLVIDLYFARIFNIFEYGSWRQFLLIIQFFLPLLFLGIPDAFKYYAALEKEKWHIHYINSIILAIFFGFILLLASYTGIFSIIWNKLLNNSFLRLINSFLPFIFILAVTVNLQKYVFVLFEKTKFLIFGSILTAVIILFGAFNILRLKTHYSLIHLFSLIYVLASLIPFLLLNSLTGIYSFLPQFKLKYLSQIKKYFIYGFPLFLAGIAGTIAQYADKIIISKFGGTDIFAFYAVGATEIPLITMLAASVSTVIYPRIIESVNYGRQEEAQNIWYSYTLRVSRLTYPVIIVMIVFADKIIKLFYTEKFLCAIPVFVVYLFILFARNNSYGLILLGGGKTRLYFSGQLIETILNIIFGIVLFYLLGPIGPAISTLLLLYCLCAFYLYKEGFLENFLARFIKDMGPLVITVALISIFIRLVLNMIL